MITNLQAATIEYLGSGKENNHYKAHKIAGRSFDRVYRQAKTNQRWANLIGKKNNLPVISFQAKAAKRTVRIVVVPLNKIVGSESRSKDFDAEFRPLNHHNRERWINIAIARRKGIVLPAVELVQDGDQFYVRDGHHRISVAKVVGQLDIDARVVN